MTGPIESKLVKQCNITRQQARKIVRAVKRSLDIDESVIWTGPLEAECLRFGKEKYCDLHQILTTVHAVRVSVAFDLIEEGKRNLGVGNDVSWTAELEEECLRLHRERETPGPIPKGCVLGAPKRKSSSDPAGKPDIDKNAGNQSSSAPQRDARRRVLVRSMREPTGKQSGRAALSSSLDQSALHNSVDLSMLHLGEERRGRRRNHEANHLSCNNLDLRDAEKQMSWSQLSLQTKDRQRSLRRLGLRDDGEKQTRSRRLDRQRSCGHLDKQRSRRRLVLAAEKNQRNSSQLNEQNHVKQRSCRRLDMRAEKKQSSSRLLDSQNEEEKQQSCRRLALHSEKRGRSLRRLVSKEDDEQQRGRLPCEGKQQGGRHVNDHDDCNMRSARCSEQKEASVGEDRRLSRSKSHDRLFELPENQRRSARGLLRDKNKQRTATHAGPRDNGDVKQQSGSSLNSRGGNAPRSRRLRHLQKGVHQPSAHRSEQIDGAVKKVKMEENSKEPFSASSTDEGRKTPARSASSNLPSKRTMSPVFKKTTMAPKLGKALLDAPPLLADSRNFRGGHQKSKLYDDTRSADLSSCSSTSIESSLEPSLMTGAESRDEGRLLGHFLGESSTTSVDETSVATGKRSEDSRSVLTPGRLSMSPIKKPRKKFREAPSNKNSPASSKKSHGVSIEAYFDSKSDLGFDGSCLCPSVKSQELVETL